MRKTPYKSPKKKKTKCQGLYSATKKECRDVGCNHVTPKLGATYCRSPMKRKLKSPTKSPKRKPTKCQGMYNASPSDCQRTGCNFVKPKSGGTYCRSPMKRKPKSPNKSPKKTVRKSPKKLSKCQGKNGASVGDCHEIGCNYVKPKVGSTYCRSLMNRKPKSTKRSPKRYAKKTKRSSPKSSPKYAKKTRRYSPKSSLYTNIVELE